MAAIDLDRGVTMKVAGIAGQQIFVCMYMDEPGVYMTQKGAPIDVETARKAGFDVDTDLKEKLRREKRAAAMAEIDKEFEVMSEGEVIEDTGDYKVVHRGRGWFDVIDADEGVMNQNRMRREQAVEFLDVLRRGKEKADGTTA